MRASQYRIEDCSRSFQLPCCRSSCSPFACFVFGRDNAKSSRAKCYCRRVFFSESRGRYTCFFSLLITHDYSQSTITCHLRISSRAVTVPNSTRLYFLPPYEPARSLLTCRQRRPRRRERNKQGLDFRSILHHSSKGLHS